MNHSSVSVVIPTFNGRDRIGKCLDSIARQSIGGSRIEVIVVDDGSTDGTADAVRQRNDPFRLVILQTATSGPPRARNKGTQNATHDIVAFLDDDVQCRPDCFENALLHFVRRDVAVVEASLLLEGSDRPLLRRADAQGFITAAIFFRKEALLAVGGMDEEFFDSATRMFFRDDSDLGFRILNAGHKTIQPGDVVAWHPEIFRNVRACFGHVRRYMFDPLLYRKHPVLYRRHIERKRIGPISVGRPMHYACILSILAYGGMSLALCFAQFFIGGVLICLAIGMTTVVRFKFQGTHAMRIWRVWETMAFAVLPLWYVFWLLRGCMKFGSFGALI